MFPPLPRRPFWQRHPWFTGAVAVLAGWLVWSGAHVVVAIAAAAVLAVAVRRRRRTHARRDAQLRARAEFEHRLSLAGDVRGVYGRYPPVRPGWFTDPVDARLVRYFDGALWTGHRIPR